MYAPDDVARNRAVLKLLSMQQHVWKLTSKNYQMTTKYESDWVSEFISN